MRLWTDNPDTPPTPYGTWMNRIDMAIFLLLLGVLLSIVALVIWEA